MDETIDENGNTIEKLDDGSTRITTPDGRTFSVDKDGNTNVNLPTIQKVSIDNIIDLKSHIIMRDGNQTMHNIELLDGGTVKLVLPQTVNSSNFQAKAFVNPSPKTTKSS